MATCGTFFTQALYTGTPTTSKSLGSKARPPSKILITADRQKHNNDIVDRLASNKGQQCHSNGFLELANMQVTRQRNYAILMKEIDDIILRVFTADDLARKAHASLLKRQLGITPRALTKLTPTPLY